MSQKDTLLFLPVHKLFFKHLILVRACCNLKNIIPLSLVHMNPEKNRPPRKNEDGEVEHLKRMIANYKHQIEILKKMKESSEQLERLSEPDSHYWLH